MLFFLLINVIMPTIVGILTFISGENFMLNCVEHEKSFITSGPDFHAYVFIYVSLLLLLINVSWMFPSVRENVKQQYTDNIRWIKEASKHKMVCIY